MADPRERFLVRYVGAFAPFSVARAQGSWLRGSRRGGTAAAAGMVDSDRQRATRVRQNAARGSQSARARDGQAKRPGDR